MLVVSAGTGSTGDDMDCLKLCIDVLQRGRWTPRIRGPGDVAESCIQVDTEWEDRRCWFASSMQASKARREFWGCP